MPEYPLALRVTGRLCVVVGAGAVGRRKTQGLFAAGAKVRVIDPRRERLLDLAPAECFARPFRDQDLAGALLVFAATEDRSVNQQVIAAAHRRGILVQSVDDPEASDFHLPALLRRKDLTVAVSSAGKSPALSALVRDEISATIGTEWGTVLDLVEALRRKRLTETEPTPYNRDVLRDLLAGGLVGLVAAKDTAAVEQLLHRVLGKRIALDQLDIPLPKGMR